jgi:hypothetical protein
MLDVPTLEAIASLPEDVPVAQQLSWEKPATIQVLLAELKAWGHYKVSRAPKG